MLAVVPAQPVLGGALLGTGEKNGRVRRLGKSLAGRSRVIWRVWLSGARMPEIDLALPAAKSPAPLISLAYGLGDPGDGWSGSSWRSTA